MGSILRAKDVIGDLQDEILRLMDICGQSAPKLTCINVGNNSETQSYLASIKRILTSLYGIQIEVIEMDAHTEEQEIISLIHTLNHDLDTSAIMLMRPLPDHIDLDKVQSAISPSKDVDGVSPTNRAGFWMMEPQAFGSCTAQAALYMLEKMVDDIKGMNVVVVGRSQEVGRPIAELLLRHDATVTMCHSATDDLPEHLKSADAVVSCVGVAHLIDGSMLKEGACVVDVGMSMLDGMLVGDVDIDTALERAKYVTPAIGGVGAITTHMLALHVIQAKLMQA